MAYKEKEIKKVYYSIGEVAKIFDVSTSLIRFWEGEFDMLKPRKNRKGNRLFTESDIKVLQMIFHLVKEKGYTLEGAKKKLREDKDKLSKNFELIDRLKLLKDFLEEMKSQVGGTGQRAEKDILVHS